MFSFLSITLSLIGSIVLYFAYRYIIGPYLLLQHYKKQGGKTFFHKNLVSTDENFKNALEKNDYFHIYNEAVRADPKVRFIAENFGDKVLFVPIDFEMVKEVLSKLEVYEKSKEAQGPLADLAMGTLSFAEGAIWKKQRKMVSSVLNFEFIKALVPMIKQVSQDQFKDWIQKGELENINLMYNMGSVTGEVSGRFFFGQKFNKHTVRGLPMTTAAQKVFDSCYQEQISFFATVFGPELIRKNILPRHKELNNLIHDFRAKCKEMIRETMAQETNEANLLSLLMDYYKGSTTKEDEIVEQIIGEFVGLFIAGTETTALSVSTTLYYLAKNPRCLEKVREEIDKEIANIDNLEIDQINHLEYTTACLKETVRLGAGVGGFFFREAIKDDNLCGVHIKKGTILNVFGPMFHYNEKYYSNPEEFIPERWLGDARFAKDGCRSEPFSFLAFSAGPRNCVGQHLSVTEAKIIIAVFMKTFNYKVPEAFQIKWLALGSVEPVLANLETKK